MPASFSYDPAQIMDGGLNQMRFELGDTVVDMDGISSALCDEEYNAILSKYGKNWRQAKYLCLRAIMMKMSYEVNTSVDGLSYSLSERYKRWKDMLDEAKKEMGAMYGVPTARADALMPSGGTPYFYNDMQANYRKFGPTVGPRKR